MAPVIKLYYAPFTCSMASQLILEDSGLEYEAVKINHRDPAIRAEYIKNVNPKGQVPALSIDGEIITESSAILTAISQLIPQKNYAGSTPMGHVRFLEWMNYLSGTIHSKYYGGLWRASGYTNEASAEDGIKAKSKENLIAAFKDIDAKLTGDHALEGHLTGIDGYLLVFASWAKHFGFWDAQAFPKYNTLIEKLSETPACKAMMSKQA